MYLSLEKRGREGERETVIGCLSHAPKWGHSPQAGSFRGDHQWFLCKDLLCTVLKNLIVGRWLWTRGPRSDLSGSIGVPTHQQLHWEGRQGLVPAPWEQSWDQWVTPVRCTFGLFECRPWFPGARVRIWEVGPGQTLKSCLASLTAGKEERNW